MGGFFGAADSEAIDERLTAIPVLEFRGDNLSLTPTRGPFILAAGLDGHMQVGEPTTMGSNLEFFESFHGNSSHESGSEKISLMTVEEPILSFHESRLS